MAQTEVFQVYLAGPISGCNEAQKTRWRDEVKRAYGDRMTFIDPVEQLLEPGASPYEFVEADLQAIEAADGLLVNMWRESIGTAIGVAHAHLRSRTIVVCDPNRLGSSMLNFFADAVADTPLQGAKMLWSLLRAERRWHVNKHGGRTERFERRKIMEAVRGACRSAACDDITVPRLVIPEVIDRLERTDRKINESLTTTDIDQVVVDVLRRLEDEPAYRDSATGVVDAWRGHAAAGGDGVLPTPSPRVPDPLIPRSSGFRSPRGASRTGPSGARPFGRSPTSRRPKRGASSGRSCRCPASRGSRSGRSAARVSGRTAGHGSACPARPTSSRGGSTTVDPRGRCSPSRSMCSRMVPGPRSGG